MDIERPNPDALLSDISGGESRDGKQGKHGKLKIFFGYAAGVGKTYAMLDDAREHIENGVDVVAGYIEPHTRPETMQLLAGMTVLPTKKISYKNIELNEFDLDAALERKPRLILIDELAHTNAAGTRNKKRYQDVEELLNAGIDVYTTVNVQHLESLNNVLSDITNVTVRETVPDSIFDRADKIKLIDVEPDELLERFEQGKIYRPERAEAAMQNFFTRENLKILREIALRKAADRITRENQNISQMSEKMASSKLMVCVSQSPSSAKCIRWAERMAEAFFIPWVAVYVENEDPDYLSEAQKQVLRHNIELAERMGAEIVTLSGVDVATVIAEYARLSGITNVVIGKSRHRRLFRPSFDDALIAVLPNIEIHIIPDSDKPGARTRPIRRKGKLYLSDTLKALLLLAAATLLSYGLRYFGIGDQNVIMLYILAVLVISRWTRGHVYGIVSSLVSVLAFNFFFTDPFYTFSAIGPGYPVTFLIMLLSAIITSTLTVRVKTQAKLAVQRERRTEVMYQISTKLLATRGLDNIVDTSNEYIMNLFTHSVIFYTKDNGPGCLRQADGEDAAFMLEDSEKAVAHWAFVNQKPAGAGTDTLMGAGAFYMPVVSQGESLGVIGLSCKHGKLSQNSKFFLKMIISQVAMALERQFLSDEQHQAVVAAAETQS